ncbi:hypothetical protein [uncultured Cocleimonas sp.]|uniref:hypothetical protein n=1 Tax=uncultured Cocleimonas sp. TaxID=1051587 RepID=UPI0026037B27|nr:hypothetical protein [uncultured Cocleimonas sp.]
MDEILGPFLPLTLFFILLIPFSIFLFRLYSRKVMRKIEKDGGSFEINNRTVYKKTNWLLIFILMVIAFPITLFIVWGKCFWGGCGSQNGFMFLLGAELVFGVFSLIAAIVTSIRKN